MGSRHRRIVWTRAAAAALDEAIGFVAEDSPRNAVTLLNRVLDAAASLSSLADRGAPIPEIDDPTVRQLLPDPYRLIYRVQPDQVTILTVLHQRRDVALWSRREVR